MMTQEETRVLRLLYQRGIVAARDILSCCYPGWPRWGERVLSQLEWLGCVTIFYSTDGLPTMVEITQHGIDALQQRAF